MPVQEVPATTGETPAAIDAMSVRTVVIDGHRFHRIGDWVIPVIAGGSDEDDGGEGGGAGASGAAGAGNQGGGDSGADDGDESKLPENVRAILAKNRKELKAARDQVKALEPFKTKVEEQERANQTETERLATEAKAAKDRADAAEAELKTERTRSAIERAAVAAGFQDAEDAVLRLMGKVEYDEEGKVKNAKALVEQLAKDKPYLLGNGSGPTAKPGNAPSPKPAGKAGEAETIEKEKSRLAAAGVRGLF